MKETGIADTMIILPEFEFYLFDSVGWEVQPYSISMNLDVNQAPWNSARGRPGMRRAPPESLSCGEAF